MSKVQYTSSDTNMFSWPSKPHWHHREFLAQTVSPPASCCSFIQRDLREENPPPHIKNICGQHQKERQWKTLSYLSNCLFQCYVLHLDLNCLPHWLVNLRRIMRLVLPSSFIIAIRCLSLLFPGLLLHFSYSFLVIRTHKEGRHPCSQHHHQYQDLVERS